MLCTGPVTLLLERTRALPTSIAEPDMRGQRDSFFEVTARWRLTHAERRALLGSPTDELWSRFMHDADPNITTEELARLRAVIQIDAALSARISDQREQAQWLRTLQRAPPFFGRTPLALLFRGIDGFKAIAEYLTTPPHPVRISPLH